MKNKVVTRKAILIGAPGGVDGSVYLNGVNEDLKNVRRFLLSNREVDGLMRK
jgi:hypothetical protein